MIAELPTSPTVNISLVVVEAVIEVEVVVVEVVVAYHVLLLPAGPTVNMSLDPAGVWGGAGSLSSPPPLDAILNPHLWVPPTLVPVYMRALKALLTV